MKICLLLLMMASYGLCENLKEYDRLASDNVTVKSKSIAARSSTRNDYKTDYGSYDKTKDQQKSIEITVEQRSGIKSPLTIKFYFVMRDAESKAEKYVSCDPVILDGGSGSATFSETATSNDLKLAAIGVREKTGFKIYGWFARAIRDGKIIGISSSNERFSGLAADPKKFSGE